MSVIERNRSRSTAGERCTGRGGLGTRRGRRGSAFSLIELVTVIAILSIVAVATGVPTLSYMASLRAGAAAVQLTGDLRYAQRTALSAGLRTWVVFNAAGSSYRLYIEDSGNPGKAHRLPLTQPVDQSTQSVQFNAGAFAGVTISAVNIGGTNEVEFDTFGVPYDADGSKLITAGTVTLSSGASVTVHPLSGHVERTG